MSGFSGDAGDAIAATAHPKRIVNGMKFTCMGEDNDKSPDHCMRGVSGWWLNNCARSDLNFDRNACWNSVTDVNIKDVESSRMLVKLN